MGSLKEYKNIKIEIKGHVGCITLQRSEANNALNIETSKDIYDGCKTLESHSSIRVIFIQGNQKLFSPGADIKELNSLTKTTANEKGLFNFFDKNLFLIKKSNFRLAVSLGNPEILAISMIVNFS